MWDPKQKKKILNVLILQKRLQFYTLLVVRSSFWIKQTAEERDYFILKYSGRLL